MAPQFTKTIILFEPQLLPPPWPEEMRDESSSYTHHPVKTNTMKSSYTDTISDFLEALTTPTSTPTSTPFAELGSTSQNSIATSTTIPGNWSKGLHGKTHSRMSAAAMGAAGAVGMLAFILLVGGLVFCMYRRSRRRKDVDADSPPGQQMVATTRSPDTRAYVLPPINSSPSTLASPSTASSPPAQPEEPPVLLSRTMDQSYYTGLDTSDLASVTDNRRNSASASDAGYAPSITEPPPPYRPASIPPFSRDSSVRIPSGRPPSYGPRLSVRSQREPIRSPFEDPEGDSPISETSEAPPSAGGSARTRDLEEMSEVSELSYQQEPMHPRSSLN